MINSKLPEKLEEMIEAAVSHYWDTRLSQQQKQQNKGRDNTRSKHWFLIVRWCGQNVARAADKTELHDPVQLH